ncbi:DNA replication terminus site-binding protein [Paramixta manurensis]|uniref:DNA replication terminus site-binding protein n=1 Tax=Paramixta manurensis TaxID=2740817 RepID=A0A6M8U8R3_9GAMM|nr:DNA replication terminus site-binding protein [Erwiniaceae bacterium PD-1]
MRYDLPADLRRCATALEHALAHLNQQLSALPLLIGRGFALPPINKGTEHDPVTTITVTQHLGVDARDRALAHYQLLFLQQQSEKISTKAAVRLPGILCFEANAAASTAIHQQVNTVNRLKARLEQLITVDSGLSSEARFDFVHTHLRGLLTLNAYRAITLLDAPDTVRFGWANKHIIKNVTQQEIIEKLEKSLKSGRAQAPWTREQWAEKVEQERDAVRALPPGAKLKIKRPVKVQPIARVWHKQQQKQTQLACPSPLLVLCPDRSTVPLIGELLNYDAAHVTHRHKPAAAPLFPLIPRWHLYSDR